MVLVVNDKCPPENPDSYTVSLVFRRSESNESPFPNSSKKTLFHFRRGKAKSEVWRFLARHMWNGQGAPQRPSGQTLILLSSRSSSKHSDIGFSFRL